MRSSTNTHWQVICYLLLSGYEADPDVDNIPNCHQISNIERTEYQNWNVFRLCLEVVFAQSIDARCLVHNEDVVGAAATGDAQTTSEWSIIIFPTKVRLILQILRYVEMVIYHCDILP